MLMIETDRAPEGSRRGDDLEVYAGVDGPGFLLLEPTGTADEAAAQRAVTPLFEGGRSGAAGGPWLFRVGLWTPADHRTEFLAWYSVEHLPMLLACPQWDGCRFVEVATAEGCQFYALHQLSDRAALDSAERRASRETPWFVRLRANRWFDGDFTRALYRRVER